MNTNLIKEIIKERNPKALFIEKEFDEAILGTGKTVGKQISAVYDSTKCIELLIKNYNMDELEALDQFNDRIDLMKEEGNSPIFFSDFTKIKEIQATDIKESKSFKEILDNII